MRRVVLESPYAGDIDGNVAYARRCIRDSLGRGESPLASHLLYTQPDVLDDANPEERDHGIAAGHAWIAGADAVVVYLDRGMSIGMAAAVGVALVRGTPIEYRNLDGAANEP